jgi:hypothetical protein
MQYVNKNKCVNGQLTCAVRNLEFHGNVSSCKCNEEFKNIILTAKRHSLDTQKHAHVSAARILYNITATIVLGKDRVKTLQYSCMSLTDAIENGATKSYNSGYSSKEQKFGTFVC